MTDIDDDFTLGDLEEANPALLEAAEKVTSGQTGQDAPTLEDPLDGPVSLVAGFQRVRTTEDGVKFEEIKKAWVRELNGEDEERISRARMKDDINEFIKAVLEAGVEKLGDEKPSKADLLSLVLGDRDYLLLEIARATYGDELEYDEIICPECGESFSATLSIAEDIPVKRLASMDDVTFEVALKRGRVATVTLPTGEISAEAGMAETPAQTNTILITHAVREIKDAKGEVVPIQGDTAAAKRLGIQDRQTLVAEMSDRMPGPQYNKVRFNHEPGCGKEIQLRITLLDLFRGL